MAEVLKLVAVIAMFVVQVCFAFSCYESGIIYKRSKFNGLFQL